MATIQELESFKLSDAVKFNDTLNPVLWEDEKLKTEIRDQLKVIAEDFADYLGISDLKIQDITISGSNAAFTWTPHSDIDLHLLVDFDKLPNSEIYQELFTAKKTVYNDIHDITIKGIPVELYVQDSTQPHYSMGEYSILNDDWNHIPKKEKPNFDEPATKLKYEKLGGMIEIALKTQNLEKVKRVLKLISRYRQAGLAKHGEFGPEALAFKAVRKQGLLQKLHDLKKELVSKKLSIDENDGVITETIEESELLNILAKYAARDLIDIIKKFKNIKNVKLVNDIVTKGVDFLDLNLPDIKNSEFKSYLQNLRIKLVGGTSLENSSAPESLTIASYNVVSQMIKIDIDALITASDMLDVPIDFKLSETLSHEIQHHIDNIKSNGNAFNASAPNNFDEYLKLPYEVNARMQEAFFRMGKAISSHKSEGSTIDNELLKQYILYAMNDARVDEVYEKNQEQYKQLVKRLYKYAYKLIHSPAQFTPANFTQKMMAMLKGKQSIGTLGENVEYSNFKYKKNPTAKQLYTLTKNSKDNHLRGIYHNGKTYWWDANDAIHKVGAEILGLPYDYTKRLEAAIDKLSDNYYVGGDDGVPNEIIAKYETDIMYESSGYIPSEKEKNDPRYKMALTKDVRPDAVKKNAKAFNWKTNRAGVPPELKTNGKFE
jgi:hypothetical protein